MWLAALAGSAAAAGLGAQGNLLDEEPEFLTVDQAFVLTTDTAPDGALHARWEMPDGYYLYRHRFEFKLRDGTAASLGAAEIPPGKNKVDEWFGDVEVYYHSAQARVPVSAPGLTTLEIGIGYQGCADAGLCYPPETRWVTIPVVGGAAAGGGPPVSGSTPTASGTDDFPVSEEQQLASLLTSGGLAGALAIFFLAGIALTFTPCVLPMVPILSSIIVGEGDTISRARATTLSVVYVVGMALTYAMVGSLVGLFGASLNLRAALQSPPVLITFSVVFVLLAMSMFGFYELRLPARLHNALAAAGDRQQGGKYVGVFIMGALSSLVVSPCVSAPLAGALVYISATGDAVLGGLALFALGLGMGLPLIAIGASGGHLLPRAGAWMDSVKAVFGVMLLAVAVWLLERVVPAPVTLALWAALAIGSGVYLGAFEFGERHGWGRLWKATGVFSLVYGVLLLIGAASGANDPLRPLGPLTAAAAPAGAVESSQPAWQPVKTLADLDAGLAAARAAGKPALLDLYADWCVSCKVMERNVFPREAVAAGLRQFHLLRADVTRNDEHDRALMDAYGLFGPPSLVFFADDGREINEYRLQGEVAAEPLARHLEAVLARVGDGERPGGERVAIVR
jgi:thiol:disulfide interchange protein DsbD